MKNKFLYRNRFFLGILLSLLFLIPLSPTQVRAKDTVVSGRILDIDYDLLQEIGIQAPHSDSCACFCMAYTESILDGKIHNWAEYDANGGKTQTNTLASWGVGGYGSDMTKSLGKVLGDTYDSINKGQPVIVFVKTRYGYGHWVTIVGYQSIRCEEGKEVKESLTPDDFLIVDSLHTETLKDPVPLTDNYTIGIYSDGFYQYRTAYISAHADVLKLDQYRTGARLSLGKWEQDGNLENGPEVLKWIVLGREGEYALLLSEKIIDYQPYDGSVKDNRSCTWQESDLSVWMKRSFTENAFTADENAQISAEGVFLLNSEEAAEYLEDTAFYRSYATAMAKKQGIPASKDGYASWWLRDGAGSTHKMMNTQGEIATPRNYLQEGIRPALWIYMEE